MKKLLLILSIYTLQIIFLSDLSYSQVLTKVMRATQVEKLQKMADSVRRESETRKAQAILYAKQNNLTIREVFEDGTVIELQSIGHNGIPVYSKTDNSVSAQSISTDQLRLGGWAGLNLTGQDMILGEWDAGAVLGTHQELVGRVTQVDRSRDYSDHSTHVAGTLIASGVVAEARGMAYEATLNAYDWNSEVSEMLLAASNGLLISNHSHGNIAGWYHDSSENRWYWYGDISISETEDYHFGYYSEKAMLLDEIANLSPYYLIVKSSGNDRNDRPELSDQLHYFFDGGWTASSEPRDPDGGSSGFDCISTWGTAKNILTVGAGLDVPYGYRYPIDVNLTGFSSRGPTDDGRIKPDIVANGEDLYSSGSDNATDYSVKNGTSMSSPNAAGSLILLQQYHQETYGYPMLSATLKGLVIHTADEAGYSQGPDYKYGWGLMNSTKAVNVIQYNDKTTKIEENTLINGSEYTFSFTASGDEPLIATICWTDPEAVQLEPALNNRTPLLVNDLDLRISDTESVYLPWVLDPDNPSESAVKADNIVDNVEQIIINEPVADRTYTISVSHKDILKNGLQNFSLILSGLEGEKCTFSFEDLYVVPGANGNMDIDLDNDIAISNLRLQLFFDSSFLVFDDPVLTQRTESLSISATIAGNFLNVEINSIDGTEINIGSGSILNIPFSVSTRANRPSKINILKALATDENDQAQPVTLYENTLNAIHPPVILTESIVDATEDNVYQDSLQVEDDDGGKFIFSLLQNPAWMSIDTNGVITGVPSNSDVGSNHAVTIIVADETSLKDTLETSINVLNVNDVPVITFQSEVPDKVFTEGDTVEFYINATDIDNDSLEFVWFDNDTQIAIDKTSDTLSVLSRRFTYGSYGPHQIKVQVSDGVAASERQWELIVQEIFSQPDTPVVYVLTGDETSINANFPANSYVTLLLNSENNMTGNISIEQLTDISELEVPIEDFAAPAYTYDINSTIENFEGQISFGYSDSLLNIIGIDEDSLAVSFYDSIDAKGYIWHSLPITINKDENYLTGETNHLSVWAITSRSEPIIVSVNADDTIIPDNFELSQNYPNPFNPSTTIQFDLPKHSNVSLKVFDVLGREVRSLISENKPAGSYSIVWDSRNNFENKVGSGVYFYVLQTGEFFAVRKMILIR